MNLAIRGIDNDLGERNADTFHNDLHKGLKADYILANPPLTQVIGVKNDYLMIIVGDLVFRQKVMPTMHGLNI